MMQNCMIETNEHGQSACEELSYISHHITSTGDNMKWRSSFLFLQPVVQRFTLPNNRALCSFVTVRLCALSEHPIVATEKLPNKFLYNFPIVDYCMLTADDNVKTINPCFWCLYIRALSCLCSKHRSLLFLPIEVDDGRQDKSFSRTTQHSRYTLVFTFWRHGNVPSYKWNWRPCSVVPNQPCGSWTLFLCIKHKSFVHE